MNSLRFIQAAIEYEGAPSDRHRRGRRHGRAGNPPLRSRPRRNTVPCAPRKRRMITAISPIPTSCRSRSSRHGSTEIAANLPELPDAKKARFMGDYGLSDYDASVLTTDLDAAQYFEDVVAAAGDGKLAANWVIKRAVRPSQEGRARHRRQPRLARATGAGSSRSSSRATSRARSPRTSSRSSIPRAAIRPRSSRRAA